MLLRPPSIVEQNDNMSHIHTESDAKQSSKSRNKVKKKQTSLSFKNKGLNTSRDSEQKQRQNDNASVNSHASRGSKKSKKKQSSLGLNKQKFNYNTLNSPRRTQQDQIQVLQYDNSNKKQKQLRKYNTYNVQYSQVKNDYEPVKNKFQYNVYQNRSPNIEINNKNSFKNAIGNDHLLLKKESTNQYIDDEVPVVKLVQTRQKVQINQFNQQKNVISPKMIQRKETRKLGQLFQQNRKNNQNQSELGVSAIPSQVNNSSLGGESRRSKSKLGQLFRQKSKQKQINNSSKMSFTQNASSNYEQSISDLNLQMESNIQGPKNKDIAIKGLGVAKSKQKQVVSKNSQIPQKVLQQSAKLYDGLEIANNSDLNLSLSKNSPFLSKMDHQRFQTNKDSVCFNLQPQKQKRKKGLGLASKLQRSEEDLIKISGNLVSKQINPVPNSRQANAHQKLKMNLKQNEKYLNDSGAFNNRRQQQYNLQKQRQLQYQQQLQRKQKQKIIREQNIRQQQQIKRQQRVRQQQQKRKRQFQAKQELQRKQRQKRHQQQIKRQQQKARLLNQQKTRKQKERQQNMKIQRQRQLQLQKQKKLKQLQKQKQTERLKQIQRQNQLQLQRKTHAEKQKIKQQQQKRQKQRIKYNYQKQREQIKKIHQQSQKQRSFIQLLDYESQNNNRQNNSYQRNTKKQHLQQLPSSFSNENSQKGSQKSQQSKKSNKKKQSVIAKNKVKHFVGEISPRAQQSFYQQKNKQQLLQDKKQQRIRNKDEAPRKIMTFSQQQDSNYQPKLECKTDTYFYDKSIKAPSSKPPLSRKSSTSKSKPKQGLIGKKGNKDSQIKIKGNQGGAQKKLSLVQLAMRKNYQPGSGSQNQSQDSFRSRENSGGSYQSKNSRNSSGSKASRKKQSIIRLKDNKQNNFVRPPLNRKNSSQNQDSLVNRTSRHQRQMQRQSISDNMYSTEVEQRTRVIKGCSFIDERGRLVQNGNMIIKGNHVSSNSQYGNFNQKKLFDRLINSRQKRRSRSRQRSLNRSRASSRSVQKISSKHSKNDYSQTQKQFAQSQAYSQSERKQSSGSNFYGSNNNIRYQQSFYQNYGGSKANFNNSGYNSNTNMKPNQNLQQFIKPIEQPGIYYNRNEEKEKQYCNQNFGQTNKKRSIQRTQKNSKSKH